MLLSLKLIQHLFKMRTALLGLTLILYGCAASSVTSHVQPQSSLNQAVKRAEAMQYKWLISSTALSRISDSGLPKPLLQAYFNRPSTIVIGTEKSNPLVPNASLAADFTSAASLESALENNKISTSVHYLVLDIEAWSFTPKVEQEYPIQAAEGALNAARSAGKTLIFTPATDLVKVLLGHRLKGQEFINAYSNLIAKPGARVSDIFEIQAQGTEGTALSRSFASSTVSAIQSVNNSEPFFVGLSTNPDGRQVSPSDLLDLVKSFPNVSGFWLNVPQTGAACPKCGQAQPKVGVEFLEQLAGMNPVS